MHITKISFNELSRKKTDDSYFCCLVSRTLSGMIRSKYNSNVPVQLAIQGVEGEIIEQWVQEGFLCIWWLTFLVQLVFDYILFFPPCNKLRNPWFHLPGDEISCENFLESKVYIAGKISCMYTEKKSSLLRNRKQRCGKS